MQADVDETVDLEHSFLSGIVLAANMPSRDQEVLETMVDLEGAETLFFVPNHRALAAAILEAFRDGQVAAVGDPTRLFQKLPTGIFDDVQHLGDYVMGYSNVATNLGVALGEIRKATIRRKGQMIVAELGAQLTGNTDVEAVIERALAAFTDLQLNQVARRRTEAISYEDAIHEGLAKIQENMGAHREGRPLLGARLGISRVDDLLNGGLAPGELTILAARPACGKTSLACQWVEQSIQLAHDPGEGGSKPWACFITLEMGIFELIFRDFAAVSGVDSFKMRSGAISDNEFHDLMGKVGEIIGKRNILVHESVRSIEDAIIALRADTLRMGCPPVMTAIDYLQLFDVEGGNGFNHAQAIGKITRSLKLAAKEEATPILLLSQLNREVETRPNSRPKLSDLRDSGSIEQDADKVIFLSPVSPMQTEDPNDPIRGILLDIAKHRNGPVGTVHLAFVKCATRFRALERHTDSTPMGGWQHDSRQKVLAQKPLENI